MPERKLEYGPIVVRYDEDGPAVDYKRAFTEGTTYYDEEGDYTFSMQLERSLDLELPTGEIVLSIPESLGDDLPYHLHRRVKPGTYPTLIATAVDEKGRTERAGWRVDFSQEEPVKWEVGFGGDFKPPFDPYQIGGLGNFVDGCFGMCDASFLAGLRRNYEVQGRRLFDEFYHSGFLNTEVRKGAIEMREGEVPGNYLGIYVSMPQHCFWGLNSSDQPVCLVNDFMIWHREAIHEKSLGTLDECCNDPMIFNAPGGKMAVCLVVNRETQELIPDVVSDTAVAGQLLIDGQKVYNDEPRKSTGKEAVSVRFRVGTESLPIVIQE